MVELVALAIYVAEDGLVDHQWALGPMKALHSNIGECQGQEAEVGEWVGEQGKRERG